MRPFFHLAVVFLLLGSNMALGAAADSKAIKRLFAEPPRQFSSAPLWVWNDLLTEPQIIETMRDLAAQKVKQVFVHPRPGLMTSYLSPDWFRLWRVALKQAELLDMNVWIYDENSYPSGFAGGFVPEQMPESRGRGLFFRESKGAAKWETNVLAVFRLGGGQASNVTELARTGALLSQEQAFLTASVQRAGNSPWHGGKCYVDLLYPGVTEKFLDITLGAYQRELGSYLGKRIPGIFTDEPNIRPAGGLPWTDDLPAQFKKRWGYDLTEHLPSLHSETGDWKRVRHNYFATLNALFIERWAKPYSDRCARLGLEMTGHYWEHDWPDCIGVPDNMSMYAWEQRPAIDCLMNQYAEHTHAQFGNIRAVRELGSIANQLGKQRTLCEVYGAGGWELRFEDMKRQADWLGVLGVNTFDQHLSYVTIRGARKRDHPQSFSYHEPWWDAYKQCGAYLERLSVIVSQGQQVNRTLVIEPTSTAWMYQSKEAALKPIGESFFNLLRSLEAAQVEYDLGCEDVIARHGSAHGRQFRIGQREYDLVVVPPFSDNLNGPTWDLLKAFSQAGGSILVCTRPGSDLPSRKDGAELKADSALLAARAKWDRVDSMEVPKRLGEMRRAAGFVIHRKPGDRGILFHMRRQVADGEVLLLVNTSIEFRTAGTIESAARGVEEWNLETGETDLYSFERHSGEVQASFDLPPCGSQVLFLSKRVRNAKEITPTVTAFEQALGPMEIERQQPNVLVLDYVDIQVGNEIRTNVYFYQAGQFAFQKNGMERNPWDSAVQFKNELVQRKFGQESGFEATYRFVIEEGIPRDLVLVLERPDLYEISCNGRPLSAIPGTWWLDKAFGRISLAPVAQLGINEIRIKAAPFTILHELEPAYVLGSFTLKAVEQGFHIVSDRELGMGRWNEQGHPFYSGAVAYEQKFNLANPCVGRYVVELGSCYGSVCKILVNGKLVGYAAYAPWECDITKALNPGTNTVRVAVVGTLKNTLGPHHGKPSLGTAWPGMFQRAPIPGPPPGTEYHTVGYGLFEPFKLKRVLPKL